MFGAPEPAVAESLLTGSEVAGRLGFSTATVYKLCGPGLLKHVRGLNAIRGAPGDVEEFLGRQPRLSSGTSRGRITGRHDNSMRAFP